MEQLVILLIIGAISLINWLLQKSAEHRARRAQEQAEAEGGVPAATAAAADDVYEPLAFEQEPSQPARPGSWEAPPDELKKFLEALGVPENQFAPEPPAPAPEPVAPPPLPVEPRFIDAAPRVVAKPDARMRELARNLERAEGRIEVEEVSDVVSVSGVHGMLRSPGGLRDAIVLREVLGAPKALQELS